MLYIMRHGKTDWNDARKLQGRTDIPLNAEGVAMARAAAVECKNVHFDICYCSPLKRAKETAKIVLQGRNIPIIPDERLTEMCFGIFEGSPDSFPAEFGPMQAFFNNPPEYVPPQGAESFQSLFDRTGDFLNKVIKPQTELGKDILIVGHGAMNSAIICQIKGIPLDKFWSTGIENCKLIRLI